MNKPGDDFPKQLDFITNIALFALLTRDVLYVSYITHDIFSSYLATFISISCFSKKCGD